MLAKSLAKSWQGNSVEAEVVEEMLAEEEQEEQEEDS